jgi:hypothetical protein
MLAGLERGVREKGGERTAIRDGLAIVRRMALVVQEAVAALISSSRFSSRSWPSLSAR